MASLMRRAAFAGSRSNFKLNNLCTAIRANDVAEYPPIVDPSKEAAKFRERESWYAAVREMPTAEFKLTELHRVKVHPAKAYVLEPGGLKYKELPFIQHVTNTRIARAPTKPPLPEKVGESSGAPDATEAEDKLLLSQLSRVVELSLLSGADRKTTTNLLDNVAHTILSHLSVEHGHLTTLECSKNSRCVSTWWHRDFTMKRHSKERPICFQMHLRPSFQLRSPLPLPPVVDWNEPVCSAQGEPVIPSAVYNPKVFGHKYVEGRNTLSVPGFWPDDHCPFPYLMMNYQPTLREHENVRVLDEPSVKQEMRTANACLSMFGWLSAIASNMGFSPFHELTHPLTTRLLLGDGIDFNIYEYQMNCQALHPDVWKEQSKVNVMWSSPKFRLLNEDGRVNQDGLRQLVGLFAKGTTDDARYAAMPHLNDQHRLSLEEQKESFVELQKCFDPRPSGERFKYEIPKWQFIYKRNKLAAPSPTVKLV